MKTNIHFIQDEISLYHVDKNGINYTGEARRSTHRLHSIIYFDGGHFIARFKSGGFVYEYDGMKNHDTIRDDRVRCIKVPTKTVIYNPFSYYITPIMSSLRA